MDELRVFKVPCAEPPVDVMVLVGKGDTTISRDGDRWVWEDERGVIGSGPMPWELLNETFRGTLTERKLDAANERLAALMWESEMGPPPKGVSTVQLLEQDKWWRPKEGAPILVSAMEKRYRTNLARFLERRASRIKFRYELSLISGPQPSGDMACDAYDAAMSELLDEPNLKWMQSQPLYRRLVGNAD